MTTLLTKMNEERLRRREVARMAAYRGLREALGKLLPAGSEVWVFGSLLKPGFYNTNARMRAAAAAVAHVPAGAEVEASNNIGPALSGRDTVLLLDGTPRWAPWVVGDTLGLDFPFCTPSQQAEQLAYLRAHGYALVYADHGYVVLHRPADARTAQALAHPLPAARLHTDICY